MADDPKQDPAPEPGKETKAKGLSETDLDDLLAQASDLAGEIAAEAGTTDATEASDSAVADSSPPPPSEAPPEPSQEPPSEPAPETGSESASQPPSEPKSEIDAQLDRMEDLVRATSDELGAGADLADLADLEGEDESSTSEAFDDVPDFMKELTEAPTGHEAAVIPEPTTTEGSVDETGDGDEAFTPYDDGDEPAPAPDGKSERRPGLVHRWASRASVPLASVATHGVTVLEVIDKPFGKVGGRIRDLLGWVAIATFATALIVLILSLF